MVRIVKSGMVPVNIRDAIAVVDDILMKSTVENATELHVFVSDDKTRVNVSVLSPGCKVLYKLTNSPRGLVITN